MQIKDKKEVLAQIESAFSNVRRPQQFVDASHCEECAEHNETLSKCDRDSIGLKELGNAGWDPMCFVNPHAFKYYFPSMVRLAFDDKTNNEYLNQFLFHITYEGNESRFFEHFDSQQVSAVADLMRFLKFNWKKKIEREMLTTDVDNGVEIWASLEAAYPVGMARK